LAVETIASTGRGQTPIFVPEGTGAGTHRVVAKVISVSRSVSTTFEVTGPAAAQEPAETPTATATATSEASVEPSPSAETGTPDASPTGEATTEATAEATTEPTVEPTATEELEPTATEEAEATATDEAEPTATEAAPVDEQTSEDTTEPTPYAVVQTSRSNTSDPGTLAVDENAATVWGSSEGVDPGRAVTLTLDYGDPVTIDHVRLLPGAAGLMGTATIETSNDGENWTFYAQPDSATADAEGWLTVELGDGDTSAEPVQPVGPVDARYLRIVFVSDGTTIALGGVAEVEAWGPAEQP
jgi:hypothetical protein